MKTDNLGRQVAENEYEAQAQKFLQKHGLSFRAVRKEFSRMAPWESKDVSGIRHEYAVTIRRVEMGKGRKNSLDFSFWGSVFDAEQGKDITAYDVLACISSDQFCPDTFGEFCREYGHDNDSIFAKELWKRAKKFAKKMNGFFSKEELDDLVEIQ